MSYVLLIFMMHGAVTAVDMNGQLACDQAKAAIVSNGGLSVKEVLCLPKSVLLPEANAKLRANPAPDRGR